MKLKIGIIGLGFVSQISHLECLKKNKNVIIEAACDKNFNLLKKVTRKYNIKKKYTDYHKMISENSLDGVVLCVDRNNTEAISEELLKKKINLLAEKPSSLSSRFAKKLSNYAIKNNCVYLTGYMKRHDDGIKKLKELLKKNKLGKIQNILYDHSSGDSYGKQKDYFKSKTLDQIKSTTLNKKFTNKKNKFFKFLNTHCHSINLMRYFVGDFQLEKQYLNKFGEGIVIFKKNNLNIILNNNYIKSNEWNEKLIFFFKKNIIELKIIKPFLKESSELNIIDLKYGVRKNYKFKTWAFQNQINYFVNKIHNKRLKKVSNEYSEASFKDIEIIEKIFLK
mgnify:CR=1 FL=1